MVLRKLIYEQTLSTSLSRHRHDVIDVVCNLKGELRKIYNWLFCLSLKKNDQFAALVSELAQMINEVIDWLWLLLLLLMLLMLWGCWSGTQAYNSQGCQVQWNKKAVSENASYRDVLLFQCKYLNVIEIETKHFWSL